MSEEVSSSRDAEAIVAQYVRDPRPDLKDLIIVHYAGTVERIARRFAGIEPLEDLVQVGYIGLLNALSKFDPGASVKFGTYATHLIAGEIKHYLRDRTQTIRQPAWLQELRQKVQKTASQLQAELGRPPTSEEIAQRCGVTEEAVHDALATQELIRVASLDSSGSETEDGEGDRLDALESDSPHISVEDRVVLLDAVVGLRELEKNVVTLFHFESLSQAEIASRLSISCNYVSHILRQSHSKLRQALGPQRASQLAPLDPASDMDSTVDEATGSYTEAYLIARLTEELHRLSSQGATLSLITIEIKGLENYGRFYGPGGIQQLMVDAASHIRSASRSLDIQCRLGKWGFAVILPGTGAASSVVRSRIAERFAAWASHAPDGSVAVSVDVGVVVANRRIKTAAELIELARGSGGTQSAA